MFGKGHGPANELSPVTLNMNLFWAHAISVTRCYIKKYPNFSKIAPKVASVE